MPKITTFLFSMLFVLITTQVSAQEANTSSTKIDPALTLRLLEQKPTNALIIIEDKADISEVDFIKGKVEKAAFVYSKLKEKATSSQTKVIGFLEENQISYKSFYVTNAILVKQINLNQINALAALQDIKRIQLDDYGQIDLPKDELSIAPRGPQAIEWGIEMINANLVWDQGHTGQNIIIGGQDTGYAWEHPALKSKYKGWNGSQADHNYNWHDAIHELNPLNNGAENPCGLETSEPCDDGSHGTHTMGTMVGSEGSNQIGVAPDAQWIGCRNMEQGWGSPSTYIECFEWFLAPTDLNGENADPSQAPHVINNSWGCPDIEGCNQSNWAVMEEVVNNLKAAGTVVVVSAGNSGSDCESVSTPAAIFENSFSVGATNDEDLITNFSSRGPVSVDGSNRTKPDISAPGRSIRSCVPGGGYASFSGTSMAGPHVAGVVALIISANPDLAGEVETIECIIEQTAIAKTTSQNCGGIDGTSIPNNTYGYGRIDALAAVTAAIDGSICSPSSTEQVDLVDSPLLVYPNPASGSFTLELLNSDGGTFELLDVGGKRLLDKVISSSQTQINVGFLAPGTYLYKWVDNAGVWTGKINLQ